MIGIPGALSQNANRKGFFVEAAFGGIVGKTPQVAFSVENNILKAHTLTGTAASLGLGQRFRISRNFAYELVLEFQAPLSAITSQPTVKLMPISFRYISPELFHNYSLYADVRLGGVFGFKGDGDLNHITLPDMPKHDISLHSRCEPTGGMAASLGVGVNVTTHFSAGLAWDMQYLIKQFRGLDRNNCLWGMLGVKLGYRF